MNKYLDDKNRVVKWPKKACDKLEILKFLFTKFEENKKYTEKEINYVLDLAHTFNDRALLRRALVDQGFVSREKDGSAYWVSQNASNIDVYKII